MLVPTKSMIIVIGTKMRPSWIQNGCGCVDHTNICEGSYKIALNIGNPLPLVLLILPLSSIQWIEQTV